MKVSRESALRSLSVISAGISPAGDVDQSNCFVFREGKAFTYNEHVACEIDSPFGDTIEGAVHAPTVLGVLSKYPDEEIDVVQTDAEVVIKTSRKRTSIRCDSEIVMPLDLVELPKKWRKLDPSFSEAVTAVKDCAATDGEKFYITCIHMTPDHVEACDNYQMARYTIAMPLRESILVKQSSIVPMLSYGMNRMGETKTWVHFKNDLGLIYSVRRHLEDYLQLDAFFEGSGDDIPIPAGIDEAVTRAELFTAKNDVNTVMIELGAGKLKIVGTGVHGKHQELKKSNYEGPDISFMIQPKVFGQLGNRAKTFQLAQGRLVLLSGPLSYATRISLM